MPAAARAPSFFAVYLHSTSCPSPQHLLTRMHERAVGIPPLKVLASEPANWRTFFLSDTHAFLETHPLPNLSRLHPILQSSGSKLSPRLHPLAFRCRHGVSQIGSAGDTPAKTRTPCPLHPVPHMHPTFVAVATKQICQNRGFWSACVVSSARHVPRLYPLRLLKACAAREQGQPTSVTAP
jgi:hypothetical protein